MAQLDYFYDAQIRRYVLHVLRWFGGFSISTGTDEQGNPVLRRVPCRYASLNRQIGHILRNNSENVVASAPFISGWIQSLVVAKERHRNRTGTDDALVTERSFDSVTRSYGANRGDSYHIQKINPVPYDLTMQIDIWTTQLDHKLQLLEQILVYFQPAIELQINSNPLDWTGLTVMELKDVSFSNRSIPAGAEDEMDIASLQFTIPVELTLPAIVKKQSLIHQIIINTNAGDDDLDLFALGQGELLARDVFTPGMYQLRVQGNMLTLLGVNGTESPSNNWATLLAKYGNFREGVSQIRVRLSGDIEDQRNDIIGSITLDNTNPDVAFWEIDPDSLPGTTEAPVDRIVNPQKNHPGNGTLPTAVEGHRYLLVDDIPENTIGWGGFVASKNDLIEYRNGSWTITFDASVTSGDRKVKNLNTSNIYKLIESEWVDYINADYYPGYWRIVI